MTSAAEQAVHQAIDARRNAQTPCDGVELRTRIDELGDMSLNTKARHDAFAEVYAALTPSGFRLMPFPDRSRITVAGHVLHIEAVVIDEAVGQVAGAIERRFELDGRFVNHQLLTLQTPYRGQGLSLVLLNQAFPFYRSIDLDFVLVHAALETGRWQWARMGFEAEPTTAQLVQFWAGMSMLALGLTPLPAGFRLSDLALLGSEPGGRQASFEELRNEVESLVTALLAGPQAAACQAVVDQLEQRVRAETSEKWGWRDEDRWRYLAVSNRLAYSQTEPAGKIVMLAGPDWHGTFDLHDPAAEAVFDQEFQRRFASP